MAQARIGEAMTHTPTENPKEFTSDRDCFWLEYDEDGEHVVFGSRRGGHLWDREGYCNVCGQESNEARAARDAILKYWDTR
jgi:hypothetical protein